MTDADFRADQHPGRRPDAPTIQREYAKGPLTKCIPGSDWTYAERYAAEVQMYLEAGAFDQIPKVIELARRKHLELQIDIAHLPREQQLRLPLTDIGVPNRIASILEGHFIVSVGDLVERSADDLLGLAHVAGRVVDDLEERLAAIGLALREC